MHIRTTAEHREQRFQDYLTSRAPYFEHIESKGDKPWFKDEERREAVRLRLGLDADVSEIDLRRALFFRKYRPCRREPAPQESE